MKSLLSATIFLAVTFAVFAREIPADVDQLVVGGTNAKPGQYPYQVSLRVYFVHFCGGSILNNRWILTAAHCIDTKRPDEISVIAGTNLLTEAGQMYQAIYKIVHPKYDSVKILNDIGLILVSRNIVQTEYIRPIALPTGNFDKVNYSATLTGWGSKSAEGPYLNELQQIKVTVMSQKECVAKQSKVTDNQICTLNKIGEGACYGDGGGPLVADGVQIGISSYVIPCAKGQPDVYTRVWTFVEWINATIKDHKGKIYPQSL